MKTLLDVVPPGFRSEYSGTPAARLLDVGVASRHDGTVERWPGTHKFVFVWWTLTNGKRVGWNENPARGWSFPVI